MEQNTVTKLTLITRKATADQHRRFTSLMHLLTVAYVKTCWQELKRGKAAGIDGRTLESYTDAEMETAIAETVVGIKQKTYRPQPVRRVYIDKENGTKRPLGIPSVIDKVVQLAVAKILEAIYEPTFLPVSYGYRPGRNAHEALKDINHMIMGKKVNYLIDADISGFFDHVDHGWMMRCLNERIADPNFKRLIRQFLTAGVMQEHQYIAMTEGTPQGGIVSPILANIYLHYVLDLWMEKRLCRNLHGYAHLVRYADDFVVGVQYQHEAQQIHQQLEKRLETFGLTLSPEKTRVLEFGRFAAVNRQRRGEKRPETFDFVGFTHYCTKTRDGRFMVRLKTSRKRMNRAVGAIQTWIKTIRNIKPLPEIWPILTAKLQGHYHYYGVSGNFEQINHYYRKTRYFLYQWMNRRSQRKTWNKEQFYHYLSVHPLPKPTLHYAIYNTW